MENVNVTTSVTEIIAASEITDRTNTTLFLQNQSDTTMRVAVGAANIALLSSSLGIVIEAGEALAIDGPTLGKPVSAIHGGSGNKVLHWQLI